MSPFAGQNRNAECKRPSLLLTIPPTQISGFLDVNLGSPFTVTTPSPLSLSFAVSPMTKAPTNPLTSIFFDWDEEPQSATEEEEQCIIIAPGEPFYVPPTQPEASPSPVSLKRHCRDFSCDALAVESTIVKTAAQLFHEELDRIIQPLTSKTFVFNTECLQELDLELFVCPLDAFSESCMDSLKRSSSMQVPLWSSAFRSLPDVPRDFDSVDIIDDEEEEEDLDFDSDDDSSSDRSVAHTPLPEYAEHVPFISSLDRRLVAPFEDTSRCSAVSSHPLFCGLFS